MRHRTDGGWQSPYNRDRRLAQTHLAANFAKPRLPPMKRGTMNTSPTVPATMPAGAAGLNGAADALQAGPCTHGAGLPGSGPDAAISDWNLMFEAVRTRLLRTVGAPPGEQPAVPPLPASLVQAVVLDCVRALDQLHAALEKERSQRPTP